MKSISEKGDWTDTVVFVRVDFNVPIEADQITDTFRITKALPTINYLRDRGAKVVLASHIGRKPENTLRPVHEFLKQEMPISFLPNFDRAALHAAVESLSAGSVLLLENLRSQPGEVDNDPAFIELLASCVDYYVNEAFPVCHRAHASIVGLPSQLPSFAGFQLVEEVAVLTEIRETPAHPFCFILGGNKFETKLPLLEQYAQTADTLIISGALMNDFFRFRGCEVGRSVVSDEMFDLAAFEANERVYIPEDVMVETGDGSAVVKQPDQLSSEDMIVDIGPRSIEYIRTVSKMARLILWNGPTGFYRRGYAAGTQAVLDTLITSSAKTVVGGGDTVALISQEGVIEKLTFVSTGGGAMLSFLAGESLPGLTALA